jgi:hypothetical protein
MHSFKGFKTGRDESLTQLLFVDDVFSFFRCA